MRRDRGRRRWQSGNRRPLVQQGALARMKFPRLFPQLPPSQGNRRHQQNVQQPKFPLQNREGPFCSGTSLRGITPESDSRTPSVFSLVLVELIRTSLVASSAFSEVRSARKLTSCSIRQSNATDTETSP